MYSPTQRRSRLAFNPWANAIEAIDTCGCRHRIAKSLLYSAVYRQRRLGPAPICSAECILLRRHKVGSSDGYFRRGPTGLMISERPKDKTPLCVCREGF